MNCESIKELLSAYIDGELTYEEQQQCLEHLESCEDCQDTLSIFMQIKNNLDVVDQINLPTGFHADLMNKLNKESEGTQDRVRLLHKHSKYKWMGYVASVAAVFVGGMIMVAPDERNEQGLSENGLMSIQATPDEVTKSAKGQVEVQSLRMQPQASVHNREKSIQLKVIAKDTEQALNSISTWSEANGVQLQLQQIQNEEGYTITLIPITNYEKLKAELLTIEGIVEIQTIEEKIEEVVTIELIGE